MTESDRSFGVIVIGGGGSGLAAAVAAAEAGARVLLLEKAGNLGGTTALAIGSFSASRTAYQDRAGVEDCPEWHFEDMSKFQSEFETRCDLELRRFLTREAGKSLGWLKSHGVVFVGPFPEPPHRVPRMHNVIPDARTYISVLRKAAEKAGVSILLGTEAFKLVVRNGRVAGVDTRDLGTGKILSFHAQEGVVLATGDYSASSELKTKYGNPDLADVDPVNPLSTGDGHKMAIEIGADVKNMDVIATSFDTRGAEMRFVPPPKNWLVDLLPDSSPFVKLLGKAFPKLPRRLRMEIIKIGLTVHSAPSPRLFHEGAILVNKEGKRFTDETAGHAMDIAKQREKVAFILFDAKIASKFRRFPYFISTFPGVAYAYLGDYRRFRKDIFFVSERLEGIASDAKMGVATFLETIRRYNKFVRSQNDLDFRRTILPCEIDTPPFYLLGPIKAWVLLAEGGVAIDQECRALDREGRPIPGLYAAGMVDLGGPSSGTRAPHCLGIHHRPDSGHTCCCKSGSSISGTGFISLVAGSELSIRLSIQGFSESSEGEDLYQHGRRWCGRGAHPLVL